MIAGLLPASVVGVDVFGDRLEASLYPEEEAQVRGAVVGRRREYATVRLCARRALEMIGEASAPLPRGDGGTPRWPRGVVGSMTHCDGYRAAAVGRAAGLLALGIDAEPNLPLPEDVADLVLDCEERVRVNRLRASEPGVCWDRLSFSAKEALYKAWYPLTGRWLGFEDAVVEMTIGTDRTSGSFRVRLTPTAVFGSRFPARASGRWTCRDQILLTVIHLSTCQEIPEA